MSSEAPNKPVWEYTLEEFLARPRTARVPGTEGFTGEEIDPESEAAFRLYEARGHALALAGIGYVREHPEQAIHLRGAKRKLWRHFKQADDEFARVWREREVIRQTRLYHLAIERHNREVTSEPTREANDALL